MIRLNQVKVSPGCPEDSLISAAAKKLGIPERQICDLQIRRHSIDCRKKPVLFDCYTVDITLCDQKLESHILHKKRNIAVRADDTSYTIPACSDAKKHVIVCGSGPAGLFCSWILSQRGVRVTVVERGADVNKRQKDVDRFWNTGILDPQSNVQFGEGGAGTFSDGKLNTLVKDKLGRIRFVLETFVACGAPADILVESHPHIGTDLLCRVITNMRGAMQKKGVLFQFDTLLDDIDPAQKKVSLIMSTGERSELSYDALVIAPGHSARDTFSMLLDKGVEMSPKSFAVGVRIIHPQSLIDRAQYGCGTEAFALPAASYKLAETLQNSRGGYTFCMCPGGYVVNASSERGHLVVNGMSERARDGKYANSAIIISVTPDDFPESGPLGGVAFQRQLEACAYRMCDGRIPVQAFSDFVKHEQSACLPDLSGAIRGAYGAGNIRESLPGYISDSLEETIRKMGKKIAGFDKEQVYICAVESRTSSPVRIHRNENGMCNIPGIYPCGEGAGYAGGIMSAAVDGIKIAEHILADAVSI